MVVVIILLLCMVLSASVGGTAVYFWWVSGAASRGDYGEQPWLLAAASFAWIAAVAVSAVLSADLLDRFHGGRLGRRLLSEHQDSLWGLFHKGRGVARIGDVRTILGAQATEADATAVLKAARCRHIGGSEYEHPQTRKRFRLRAGKG